jgi:heme o synthase
VEQFAHSLRVSTEKCLALFDIRRKVLVLISFDYSTFSIYCMKTLNTASEIIITRNDANNEEASATTATERISKFAAYYEMTKPGITRMVVLSAAAGYYLGVARASDHFTNFTNVLNFLLALFGTALVSAGSCVLNNYSERDFDKLMKRTMQRPIPSGVVSPKAALVFGIVLSVLGVGVLLFVNVLTAVLAVLTLVLYVNVYTPLKRTTTFSLLVGGLPGALPTLGGWTAATGVIGFGVAPLFAMLFFWQMPHFLALSWMYKQDYERGGYEMLAVHDDDGSRVARQTLAYILLLIPSTVALTVVQETGMLYLVGAFVLCIIFLFFSVQFLRHVSIPNARKVLLSSYLYLVGVFVLIFVDKI